uniref:Uncharacterized protein n=1 Tax=Ciona savignyi TaxID=51511 RepID=H2Y4W7_CIOSA
MLILFNGAVMLLYVIYFPMKNSSTLSGIYKKKLQNMAARIFVKQTPNSKGNSENLKIKRCMVRFRKRLIRCCRF